MNERTIDLSILMPVYDERATVEWAIEAVLREEGKKLTALEGSRVVTTLVRCRFS